MVCLNMIIECTALDALPPSHESSEVFVPPEFTDGEFFHVFVSYSSSDLQWTHDLIQQLEDRGLRVCFHDRDFIPGRPILENMSECIQQSQKVLLVLSQDFVRSHWCLLEANMSLFRDSLQRKPIVPVLLQSDLSIPLHLQHLTYLEVSRPDFSQQLLRVLCLPNHQLQSSTVVPIQQPNTYNSNVLKVIISADEDVHSESDSGVWSVEVPQELHLIIQEPGLYKEAMQIINRVNQEPGLHKKVIWLIHRVKPEKVTPFDICLLTLVIIFAISFIINYLNSHTHLFIPSTPVYAPAIAQGSGMNLYWFFFTSPNLYKNILDSVHEVGVKTICLGFGFLCAFVTFMRYLNAEPTCILEELKKASGEANTLLYEQNILMGAWTSSEICLVHVWLNACKQELMEQFPEKHDLFHNALLKISSDYACLLFLNNFPFETSNDTGHLNQSVCFCHYVLHELNSVK